MSTTNSSASSEGSEKSNDRSVRFRTETSTNEFVMAELRPFMLEQQKINHELLVRLTSLAMQIEHSHANNNSTNTLNRQLQTNSNQFNLGHRELNNLSQNRGRLTAFQLKHKWSQCLSSLGFSVNTTIKEIPDFVIIRAISAWCSMLMPHDENYGHGDALLYAIGKVNFLADDPSYSVLKILVSYIDDEVFHQGILPTADQIDVCATDHKMRISLMD